MNNDLIFQELLFECFFKIYHIKLDKTNFIAKQPYLFYRQGKKNITLDSSIKELINIKYNYINLFISINYIDGKFYNENENEILYSIFNFIDDYYFGKKIKSIYYRNSIKYKFPLVTLLLDFFISFLSGKSINLLNDYRYIENDIFYFLDSVTFKNGFLYYNFAYNKGGSDTELVYKKLLHGLRINKNNFFILVTLGQFLSNKGLIRGKIFFEKALNIDKDNIHILSNLARYIGTTYYEKNNRDIYFLKYSHNLIKKAYKIDIYNKYIWLVSWLGETYKKIGDLDNSEKFLKYANKLMIKRSKYYYLPTIWYGKLLLIKKKFRESLRVFLSLLKYSDEYDFHINLYKFISFNYINLSDNNKSLVYILFFFYKSIHKRKLRIEYNRKTYIIKSIKINKDINLYTIYSTLNSLFVNGTYFDKKKFIDILGLELIGFDGIYMPSLDKFIKFLIINIQNFNLKENRSVFIDDYVSYIFQNLRKGIKKL